MEQRIEKMVKSTKAPLNENVAWVDTTDGKSKIKIHNNGEWQQIGGDGSGLNPNVEIGDEYGTNTVNIANELITIYNSETETEETVGSSIKVGFEKKNDQYYAAVDAGLDSGGAHISLLNITATQYDYDGKHYMCPKVEIQTFPYGTPMKLQGMCTIENSKLIDANIEESTIRVGSGATSAIVYNASISDAAIGPIPQDISKASASIKIGDESNTDGISIGGSDVGQLTTKKIIIKNGVNLLDCVQITDTMIKLADDSNSNPKSRYIQFNDDSIVFYNNGKTATLTLS